MSGSYEGSNGKKKKVSLEKRDPREAGSALMNGAGERGGKVRRDPIQV